MQQEASRKRKARRPAPEPNLTLTHEYVEEMTFDELDELWDEVANRNTLSTRPLVRTVRWT